jgi:S1-C subfamily serine protease
MNAGSRLRNGFNAEKQIGLEGRQSFDRKIPDRKMIEMKTRIARIFTNCGLLVLGMSTIPLQADEAADKGGEIFQKNQHAVVTVEVVLKTSRGDSSQSSESKQDITGTVLDPSGLTVVALSACDPSELYQRMMGDDYSKYKVETEITDLKLLLDDGTEIPAEIILRDKDLDMAFVRPKLKPANPMAALDLTQNSKAKVLEQVIALNRLNSAAGRAYSASVERVSAVIQKPRTFYIADGAMTSTTLGAPVFSLNGNVLGMVVMRAVSSKGTGSRSVRDSITPIILPAEYVLKAAKQAPESKPEADKKEEAKPAGESK